MKPLMITAGLMAGLALASNAAAEGLTFGVELPVLSVHANHGAGEIAGGNAWFDNTSATAAYRITGTYDISEDFAIRGRLFGFDGDFDDPDDLFEARTFDLEAVMGTQLGGLDLDLFAGLRVGKIDWSDEDQSDGFGFDGAGPTIGAEARHSFGNGMAMVFGGRYSAMLGETTELDNDDTSDNVMVPSVDLRLGMDYERQMANGTNMTFGIGVESTSYFSLSGNVDNDIDPEDIDVTLAGPYLRLGFSF